MSRLLKYVRPKKSGLDLVVTSLNLERRQLEHVRAMGVNLSKLVREYLDELIAESEARKTGRHQDK